MKCSIILSLILFSQSLFAGLSNIKRIEVFADNTKLISKNKIEQAIHLQMKKYLPEIEIKERSQIKLYVLISEIETGAWICYSSTLSLFKFSSDDTLKIDTEEVYYRESMMGTASKANYENYISETIEKQIKDFADEWNKDKASIDKRFEEELRNIPKTRHK